MNHSGHLENSGAAAPRRNRRAPGERPQRRRAPAPLIRHHLATPFVLTCSLVASGLLLVSEVPPAKWLALSADGRAIAIVRFGSELPEVEIRHAATGAPLGRPWRPGFQNISAMALDNGMPMVALGQPHGEISVYRWNNGQPLQPVQRTRVAPVPATVRRLSLSREGRTLAGIADQGLSPAGPGALVLARWFIEEAPEAPFQLARASQTSTVDLAAIAAGIEPVLRINGVAVARGGQTALLITDEELIRVDMLTMRVALRIRARHLEVPGALAQVAATDDLALCCLLSDQGNFVALRIMPDQGQFAPAARILHVRSEVTAMAVAADVPVMALGLADGGIEVITLPMGTVVRM